MIAEPHRPETYEGKQVQRYKIFAEIAAGGMATVHLARLTGPAGFSRIVAMKHLHRQFAADPEFRAMLIDEAWLAARIHHPNVVPTLDVLVEDGDIFLVMEYVHGEPLNVLRRAAETRGLTPTLPICSAIMVPVLQGLHAAHDARAETGQMLCIVHRDVSPHNIMVSADGVPMVLDFGVAKAIQTHEATKPGVIKGKSGYMAPEQIRGEEVTRVADVFAASVVLWELLTCQRLFGGGTELQRMNRVLLGSGVVPPSQVASGIPAELDAVVMKGLCPDPKQRYQTTLEMADALERAIAPASQRSLAAWVRLVSAESLDRRAELVNDFELSAVTVPGAAKIDLEAATVVGLSQADLLEARATAAVWSDRLVLIGIGAGLAASLLVVLVVSLPSRPRHARTAAMSVSVPRSLPRAAKEISAPASQSPLAESESQAPAPEEPPAETESPGSRRPGGEADRPRRRSTWTSRRSARDRSTIREVELADTAPPSALVRAAEPSRSAPVTADPKGRVPLVEDPPHLPLLE